MKKAAVLLLWLLSFTAMFSQEMVYKNPVISGFYPDPSVCRNGDDYYLVTSTFQYFPGVPVFHSKDLVNWKQIGHCLTRKTQLPLDNCRSSGGIYAPTIRYNNGIYYMVTTNVTAGGNFYVTTSDPSKDWSDPVWVKQGGIDPTIFFDDNGDVYFTSTGNNEIVLSKIDIETGKLLSDIKSIWAGTGGRYPEAPHIYKLNGWYYLLIAEGGTEYGHMVTIARSKNIWGPYESNPENPILTHRTRFGQYNPIQGTGHADIIQAHDNSWWMVFLGFRPVGGNFHHLGRETFLMPVKWNNDGWPYVNDLDTAGIQVKAVTLPVKKHEQNQARDNFDQPLLNPYWNFIRNPQEENYSLKEKPGFLSLKGSEASLNHVASPTFVGRRQQHFTFNASAALLFNGAVKGEEAGLTVIMDENHHYDLFVTSNGKRYELVLRYRIGSIIHTQKVHPLSRPEVTLTLKGTPTLYNFSFQEKGSDTIIQMGEVETRYLSSEVAGGFTGVYIGMYSTGNGKKCRVPALFDWFEYSGND